MLQHDYITELLAQFAEAVARHIEQSLELEKSVTEAEEIDEAVGALLDLDPQIAMRLAPASLVQMMVLSGMGDAIAEYVAYALRGSSEAYARGGDEATAALRLEQARAVEQSFSLEAGAVPAAFAALG